MKQSTLNKCEELQKIRRTLKYIDSGFLFDLIVEKRIFVKIYIGNIQLDKDIVVEALKAKEKRLEAEIKKEIEGEQNE